MNEYAQLLARLAANEQEHESFKRRLTEVEKASREHREMMLQIARQNDAIENILRSQERTEKKIERVDSRVAALEAEPAEKWRKIVWEITKAAALALAGAVAARMIGG